MSERLNELKKALAGKNPKQMRTLRNQLNNRIKSFEDEVKFGKSVPKISESHALFSMTIGECKDLLVSTKKELKNEKKTRVD